jgi:hypothetical protein
MKNNYSITEYFSIFGRIVLGILHHWKMISLTLIIGAAIGWGISYFEKSYYSADTNFFLDDSGKNSGLMGFASLAQQFKLPEALDFNNKKTLIIELLKSKEIFTRTLLKKTSFRGKDELLINQFLKIYKLPDELIKAYKVDSSLFNLVKINQLTTAQVKVLNFTFRYMTNELVTVEEQLGGIVNINIKSKDEEFAFNFINLHMESLIDFYEKERYKKSLESYTYLLEKKDSIESAIKSAEGSLANLADTKHQSVKAEVYIEQKSLERRIDILSAVLEETLQSLEVASYNLALLTSTIKIIDKSQLPLDQFVPNRIRYTLIGALAGFLLSFTIVFFTQASRVNRELKEE